MRCGTRATTRTAARHASSRRGWRIDRARSDPLKVEGPLPGPFGVLGAFLHVEWFLRTRPEHRVTAAFRAHAPDLVALADRVRLYERRGAPLEEALQHFLSEV